MQLRVLWQEILKRFPVIEVAGEPKRILSSPLRGYEELPARIPARDDTGGYRPAAGLLRVDIAAVRPPSTWM
jgi:hypothetical protein